MRGVGTRVALGILSALDPAALATGDKGAISRGPGVGPKLAARIITELKDKPPAFADVDPALVRLSESVRHRGAPKPASDAVSALITLGCAQAPASAALVAALKQAGEEAEAKTLIRLGLRELAR